MVGQSDEQLAEQIRADRIDILFDLAGHTAGNRLLVFARKPAPIQITWIGYEGTTGLAAMDYLLADRYDVPEGAEPYYREKVLRMPDGYVCYDPPADGAAGRPAAGAGEGPRDLRQLQQSGQDHAGGGGGLGGDSSPRAAVPAGAEIPRAGRRRPCSAATSICLPPAAWNRSGWNCCLRRRYAEYLAAYQQVDIALDPFPFSGSATTCEALWMGVPVITCPGETFASRHSLSHLSNVGLTETIARDLDEYVELAVALAGDLPRLAALRAGLRERMAASPLCDGQRFAANLVALLRDVWRQWVEQGVG